MWGLFISTIVTSAVDSLNPFAITQQFVLQGMVRKPSHIWYFILPTGFTNLIGGYLAYYGLIHIIAEYFAELFSRYGRLLFILELGIGFIFLLFLFKMLYRSKNKKDSEDDSADEARIAKNIRSVSPSALVGLGVVATISELTTALPYFAFMAILFNQELNAWQLSFILIIYNIIYMMPLMIMYFIYIKAQNHFDKLFLRIKGFISKASNILAPTVVALISLVLLIHARQNLI